MRKNGFPCIGLFVRGESKGNKGPRGSEGDLDPTFKSLKIGVYFEKQFFYLFFCIFFCQYLLIISSAIENALHEPGFLIE
jgi:hypothetical protein